jgi:hypothetical protein
MDDLTLIAAFRSDVPLVDESARREAWARLEQRMRRRPEPWWRRRALVLVAAALLAVAAAGTAVAFGDRIIDLVRGKPAPASFQGKGLGDPFGSFHVLERLPAKAPEEYRNFLRQWDVPGEWRGVFGFRTSAGPLTLWTGRSRGGALCYAYVWTNDDVTRPVPGIISNGSGCGADPWHIGDRRRARLLPTTAAQVGHWFPFGGKTATILSGRAAVEVRQIQVVLRDGSQRRFPVYDSFYAGELPKDVAPREVRALDRSGRILAQAPCKPNGWSGLNQQIVESYACPLR